MCLFNKKNIAKKYHFITFFILHLIIKDILKHNKYLKSKKKNKTKFLNNKIKGKNIKFFKLIRINNFINNPSNSSNNKFIQNKEIHLIKLNSIKIKI